MTNVIEEVINYTKLFNQHIQKNYIKTAWKLLVKGYQLIPILETNSGYIIII